MLDRLKSWAAARDWATVGRWFLITLVIALPLALVLSPHC